MRALSQIVLPTLIVTGSAVAQCWVPPPPSVSPPTAPVPISGPVTRPASTPSDVTPRPSAPAATSPTPGFIPTTGAPVGRAPLTGAPCRPTDARQLAARSCGAPALAIDYTSWEYWWDFNKHPYLGLRDAVHGSNTETGSDEFFLGGSVRAMNAANRYRPSLVEIERKVLPALRAVLSEPDQRDTTPAALIALAKVTAQQPSARNLHAIRQRLDSPTAAIREAAVLSLGIARMSESIDDLVAMAHDTGTGRELASLSHVDDRLRAFACYALGLIGAKQDRVDTKQHLHRALLAVVDDRASHLETRVAAIQGIRLVRPTEERQTYKDWKLAHDCVDGLWRMFEAEQSTSDHPMIAHIPVAIAEMLGPRSALSGQYRRAFREILAKGQSGDALVTQSCAIALGLLSDAGDRETSQTLHRYYLKGKDQQTRYFSLMSLARLGGEHNRNLLMKELVRGNKATEKPWCALGLGVLAFEERRTEEPDVAAIESVGRALHTALRETKNDMTQSAIAIALGLAGHTDSASDLRKLLTKYRRRDAPASYFAQALGLMGDPQAIGAVHQLAQDSERRAQPLRASATALAKLGDKDIASTLVDHLTHDDPALVTLAATASALAWIGDRRSLDGLLDVQRNEAITNRGRGYAIAALGGVIDRSRLPWQASVASNLNYRAMVSTLADGQSGILDIAMGM